MAGCHPGNEFSWLTLMKEALGFERMSGLNSLLSDVVVVSMTRADI